MPEAPENAQRDRGVLSKADRDFLRGEKSDLSEQGRRDARYRIRNRIIDSILDFQLLSDRLEQKDRQQVFESMDFPEHLVPIFRFLFQGIYDVSESLDDGKDTYENLIETAISHAYGYYDDEHIINSVDVEINVDRDRPNIQELATKFRKGEESFSELQYLRQSGEFEFDEELLSGRMMSHLFETVQMNDAVKEHFLEDEDYDTMEDYFEDIDRRIREAFKNQSDK